MAANIYGTSWQFYAVVGQSARSGLCGDGAAPPLMLISPAGGQSSKWPATAKVLRWGSQRYGLGSQVKRSTTATRPS